MADEGEFTSISFATSSTLFMSADFRPKDVARGFALGPLIPDRGLSSISPSRYVTDWGVCPTVLLTKISDRGTLPYSLTCRSNTSAGSRPIVDFIKALYMGCSDVSEFEHIYGQISTTPSCLYDPLFT